MNDIVQLRCYLKDIRRDSIPYVSILNSLFPLHPPTQTMVEVSNFALEGMLIEVDAVAVL